MAARDDGLTPKQRAFVEYYLGEAWLNKTEAARLAGYKDPNRNGITVFNGVREIVDERLKDFHLSQNEILAMQARIANLDLTPVLTEDGSIDPVAAQRLGFTRFIKKVKPTRYGKDVEFMDAQRAQEKLLDHYAGKPPAPLDVSLRFESIAFGAPETDDDEKT